MIARLSALLAQLLRRGPGTPACRAGPVLRLPGGTGYGLAVAATLLALAGRFALDPVLPPSGFPFLTFFPAVMLTVLFGGLGPGLLASALSAAAAKYFFIPQSGSFAFGSTADVIALAFFGGILLVDCVVIHAMTVLLGRVRQNRAELAASEARFRALAEATREGVVIHDGGVIADANDVFWRMHGFASRAEVIGRRIMELIAPEGREAVADSVGRGLTDAYESVGLRPDGTRFPLEIEGRAIEHAGRHMRVAVSRDLTRRRAAEAALRESEARFRGLAEALPAFVFVSDTAGANVYTNGRFQAYAGLPAEALLGDGWLRVLHPEDCARAAAVWGRAVISGERYEAEYRFRRHDGAWRWFLVRGEPERDAAGRILRWTGTCTDIDDQRRAERGLAESEAKLRTIVETVPVGIVMAELPSGRIVGSNSSVETMLRHPVLHSPDIHGYDEWVSFHADGTRVDGHEYPLARMVMAGEENPSVEVHYQRGDGTRAWMRIMGRPVRNERGEVVGGVVALVDVDAERRARDALVGSEERLRDLVATLDLGAFLARDLDGTIRFWSAGCESLYGWTADEAVGQVTHDLLGTAFPVPRAEIEAALEQAGEWAGDLRQRTREGRAVLIAARKVLRRNSEGRPASVLEVLADVTAQRRAEAELASSEARLRSIVDTAADGILVAASDGRIVSANPAALRLFGYEDDQASLLGRNLGILMPASEAARHDGYLAAHRATGQARAVAVPGRPLLGRRRDGTEFPIELSVGSFEVGGERFFTGVLRDVSQRVAAEAALRESEARFRLALEAGGMGVWSWDLATDRLEWDARQFALFGLDPAEGQPNVTEVMSHLHPEDRPGLEAAVAAAVSAGDGFFSREFRVLLPDGTARWIKGHGHAVPGPDGRAMRLVGLNLDITDAVTAREVLAREAEQLDRLAEERGRALAASEARLAHASKMEALGRLAGGIAHDFNNVLQAVQGGIALASKRLQGDPEVVRRYLGLASEAAGRGAAVTGRLLSFARRGELQSEPLAPGRLLEGLAEFLRPVLGPNIALRVEAVPGLPPLLADKGQLEAVLVNLANNARDAMPQGGGLALSAEAAPVPGSDKAPPGLAPGLYVRISVADQGEGMPPEVLTRVTEPFFTTKPKGKGTGLGLAMARGFAEQSGGGLSIESAPGRGTAVSVWLPRAQDGIGLQVPAKDGTAPGAVAAPLGGVTVLLAEDKEEVRAVLTAQLEDHGYTVWAAEDAAAALFLVEGGLRPDALVTDLAMPGAMDGLDLLGEMRARLPRLPAVLVTGHAGDAEPGRLEEAERGGPFALLRKPATPEALFDRLARVLRQAGSPGLRAAL